MNRRKTAGWALAALLATSFAAHGESSDKMPGQQQAAKAAPIVFFDIAGPDLARQSAFYSAVFGWNVAENGAVTVESRSPMHGTLRTEQSSENLLYFGVRDVTGALEQIVANGGTIAAPRFEVPGVVVLGLFFDPAGNRMGLVEIDEKGQAIVP